MNFTDSGLNNFWNVKNPSFKLGVNQTLNSFVETGKKTPFEF